MPPKQGVAGEFLCEFESCQVRFKNENIEKKRIIIIIYLKEYLVMNKIKKIGAKRKVDKTVNLRKFKRIIVPVLKRNNVVRAGIFGSFARGEAKKKSDIDILVEIKAKKFSLLNLVSLERELEEHIGRKVDLVEYSTIHPRLKDQILKEEVKIL